MWREVTPVPVAIGSVLCGGGRPFVLIAGPCVVENRDSALRHAEALRDITDRLGVPFVYKSSYDKANRTSASSFRGAGIEEGLAILAEVKRETNVPVLTDIHAPEEATIAAEVVDVLQIPAFLSADGSLVSGWS
jgi:2-dehydro-3-deoxyphosphooctonate aldolase (KDO 8-P synthase)